MDGWVGEGCGGGVRIGCVSVAYRLRIGRMLVLCAEVMVSQVREFCLELRSHHVEFGTFGW